MQFSPLLLVAAMAPAITTVAAQDAQFILYNSTSCASGSHTESVYVGDSSPCRPADDTYVWQTYERVGEFPTNFFKVQFYPDADCKEKPMTEISNAWWKDYCGLTIKPIKAWKVTKN
ncbi:hypothetical protein JX265_011492 [Neoarthrinium moseri]|uniref:Uncharacterized protein n=1 Tax=Neoarthrinium moseri TaxID=1658444 RepID=A0A9P9WC32_9PEZI|nr:hypothetical protein JX266_005516 [Neoarthrinium moseri]KAI1856533.1 hypothetical protein JX265_011492 [Neoarthrinium moseri]